MTALPSRSSPPATSRRPSRRAPAARALSPSTPSTSVRTSTGASRKLDVAPRQRRNASASSAYSTGRTGRTAPLIEPRHDRRRDQRRDELGAEEEPRRADRAPGSAVDEHGERERADRPRQLVERVGGEEPPVGRESRGPLARAAKYRRSAALASSSTCRRCRDRGQRPAQVLRRIRGRAGDRLRGRARRGVRPARSQRRRQDDDRRDPRGLPRPQRRRGQRARVRPGRALAGAARAGRDRAAEHRASTATSGCARRSLTSAACTRIRAAVDEVICADGLDGKEDALARTLSGGQLRRLDLALALVGDPRADLPRRADHGLRSRGAPQRVGHDPLAQAARQDRAADDPLPRRGAGARGPGRDHQGRADPGRGRAARARASTGDGRPTGSHTATATVASIEHETDDPTTLLHELTGAALARGERLEGLTVTRPDARGRVPRADRRGGRRR